MEYSVPRCCDENAVSEALLLGDSPTYSQLKIPSERVGDVIITLFPTIDTYFQVQCFAQVTIGPGHTVATHSG